MPLNTNKLVATLIQGYVPRKAVVISVFYLGDCSLAETLHCMTKLAISCCMPSHYITACALI